MIRRSVSTPTAAAAAAAATGSAAETADGLSSRQPRPKHKRRLHLAVSGPHEPRPPSAKRNNSRHHSLHHHHRLRHKHKRKHQHKQQDSSSSTNNNNNNNDKQPTSAAATANEGRRQSLAPDYAPTFEQSQQRLFTEKFRRRHGLLMEDDLEAALDLEHPAFAYLDVEPTRPRGYVYSSRPSWSQPLRARRQHRADDLHHSDSGNDQQLMAIPRQGQRRPSLAQQLLDTVDNVMQHPVAQRVQTQSGMLRGRARMGVEPSQLTSPTSTRSRKRRKRRKRRAKNEDRLARTSASHVSEHDENRDSNVPARRYRPLSAPPPPRAPSARRSSKKKRQQRRTNQTKQTAVVVHRRSVMMGGTSERFATNGAAAASAAADAEVAELASLSLMPDFGARLQSARRPASVTMLRHNPRSVSTPMTNGTKAARVLNKWRRFADITQHLGPPIGVTSAAALHALKERLRRQLYHVRDIDFASVQARESRKHPMVDTDDQPGPSAYHVDRLFDSKAKGAVRATSMMLQTSREDWERVQRSGHDHVSDNIGMPAHKYSSLNNASTISAVITSRVHDYEEERQRREARTMPAPGHCQRVPVRPPGVQQPGTSHSTFGRAARFHDKGYLSPRKAYRLRQQERARARERRRRRRAALSSRKDDEDDDAKDGDEDEDDHDHDQHHHDYDDDDHTGADQRRSSTSTACSVPFLRPHVEQDHGVYGDYYESTRQLLNNES